MPIREIITISAAFFLAACADLQNSLDTSPSDAAAPPPATATPATPPNATSPQSSVREAVRVPPEPAPRPESLIGLAPQAVDDLLGPPDLVRIDGPAEVRLYSGNQQACTFHIFLYVNKADARSKSVEHYEARNRAGQLNGDDLADCYRTLIQPPATS